MSSARSVQSNIIIRTLLSLIDFAFSAMTFPLIARILKPEAVGQVDFANTMATYFFTVGIFGTFDFGTREFAKNKGDKLYLADLFNQLFSFRLILGVVLFAIYWVTVIPINEHGSGLFYLSSLAILFWIVNFSWAYDALEKFDELLIPRIITRFIYLMCLMAFVKTEKDAIIYFLLMLLSDFFYYFYLTLRLKKEIPIRLFFTPRELIDNAKKLKKSVLFRLFSFSIVQSALVGLPITYLGKFGYFFEAGIYSTAMRFYTLGYYLLIPIINVLLMRSLVHQNSTDEGRARFWNQSLKAIVLIATPMAVGMILVAPGLLPAIVGPAFIKSVLVLQILSVLVLLQSVSNFWGMQVLFTKGEDRYLVKSYLFGVFVCTATLWFPMPLPGEAKAVIALLLGQFSVMVLFIIKAKKYFWPQNFVVEFGKVLVASGLMYFAVRPLPSQGLVQVFIQILVGALVFASSIVLFQHSLVIHAIKQSSLWRKYRS